MIDDEIKHVRKGDEGYIGIKINSLTDKDIIEKTRQMIEDIVKEVEVGKIYNAKVVKIEDFGCFVQLWPGCEGLVHISQLTKDHISKVEDAVKLGDEILVKALGPDKKGRQNFSRKDAISSPKTKEKKKEKSKEKTK